MEAEEQYDHNDFVAEIASIVGRLEQLACLKCVDGIECSACRAAVAALLFVRAKNNPSKRWEARIEAEGE